MNFLLKGSSVQHAIFSGFSHVKQIPNIKFCFLYYRISLKKLDLNQRQIYPSIKTHINVAFRSSENKSWSFYSYYEQLKFFSVDLKFVTVLYVEILLNAVWVHLSYIVWWFYMSLLIKCKKHLKNQEHSFSTSPRFVQILLWLEPILDSTGKKWL